MDIIKEFYSGNLFPQELCQPSGKEYKQACQKVINLEKEFLEAIGEEELKKYENLQQALVPVQYEDQTQAFRVGFSLGLLFMLENFNTFNKLNS